MICVNCICNCLLWLQFKPLARWPLHSRMKRLGRCMLRCPNTRRSRELLSPGLGRSLSEPGDKQPSAMQSLKTCKHSTQSDMAHGFISLICCMFQLNSSAGLRVPDLILVGPFLQSIITVVFQNVNFHKH